MNSKSEFETLLQERMAQAGKRVAMAAFARGNTAESVDDNGTVSFIHFPSRKLIVTNQHVWDQFREERKTDSDYKIAISGSGFSRPLDISDATVVDECKQLDLCVLSYPSASIESIGKEFCVSPNWPPARACKGDTVAIAGFPGMRRSAVVMPHPITGENVSVLHHELCLLYLSVEAVSEYQCRCVFRIPNPELLLVSGRPITELRWGGMSGSLVYRYEENKKKFFPCGVFRASGEGINAVFYATHLDKISSDGTITREV